MAARPDGDCRLARCRAEAARRGAASQRLHGGAGYWGPQPRCRHSGNWGQPQIDLNHGNDLCLNTWDVLTGQASLGGDVLVYDGTGRHPGPLAAERIIDMGANVRYVSIDAQLAEELTYAERWRWKSLFLKRGIRPVTETRLVGVVRRDNRLLATLVN